MRRIALILWTILALSGCKHLQTLNVSFTVSPTLHLDGIGRGQDIQVNAGVKK